MTAKDSATYFAYAAGWGTVRRMPEKTAYRSFNGIADRLWSRRGGGVAQLERNLPATQSVFGYYPFIVVSIDYAKMDTHRANFLQHCPECVIVDEVHGAALPPSGARGQQQRHELLRKLVEKDDYSKKDKKELLRHLYLISNRPEEGEKWEENPMQSLLNSGLSNISNIKIINFV